MIDTYHPTTATYRDVFRAAGRIDRRVDLRDSIVGAAARTLYAKGNGDIAVRHINPIGMRANHANHLEARMLWREGLVIVNLHDVACWQGGWVHRPVPGCGTDGCADCAPVCDLCKVDLP